MPWVARHGVPFPGKSIPFGALVHFHPAPDKPVGGKFGPKGVPGIFMGHVLQPGGVWKGDHYVVALDDIRQQEDVFQTCQRPSCYRGVAASR